MVSFVVILIDQWSKYKVRTTYALQHWEIIDGWFAFHYTQNPGMALGIDWLPTPVIGSISFLAILGIVAYTIYHLRLLNMANVFCMALVIGGAIGNIIDRMFMGLIQGYGSFMGGHVVDFLHFTLEISGRPVFPYIFNVADVAISTAIIIMLVFYKYVMPEDKSDAPVVTESVSQ